jgi:modification methylase
MENKIVQGDCLEVMKDIPDNTFDLIVTSPPYNKSFYDKRKKQGGKNDVWKQRKIDYGDFKDNLSPEKYEEWQSKVISECLRILKPTGSLFYNHKAFSHKHLLVYPKYVFNFPLKQIITWDRGSTPQINPCRFYPTTELIFWITKTAKQPYFSNKEI